MSSANKNLSTFGSSLPKFPKDLDIEVAIVTAEWNREVTGKLKDGAVSILKKAGIKAKNIHEYDVPGSYELPMAAKFVINKYNVQAVICIGCVIQGETPHFDFICNAVANGCMNLQLEKNVPVIFGVLTTLNQEQALDRAGGKHGNKGEEAAYTALKMIELEIHTDEHGSKDEMERMMHDPIGQAIMANMAGNPNMLGMDEDDWNDEDFDFEFDDEDEEEEPKNNKISFNPKKKKD